MSEKFDEITNIDRIEFTLYGNEEIKRASAVANDTFGINIAETYDLMEPKRGGLVDPRLGTTDSQMLCATCGLEYKYCPGHFGHTELAEPVFHIGFINIVKNILGCVCIRCSKLLLNKSLDEINQVIRNKYGKVRFAEVRKLTSGIKYCQRQDYSCGAPVPIITKKFSPTQGTVHLQAETELSGVSEEDGGGETGKKRVIEILKPKTIYTIMKNISDLDYQIMGFDTAKARPEDMIIINFPIPPNAIRPAAKRDFLSTTSFEDTLTHKLSDIVKSNIKVRKLLDKESASGEDIKYSDEYIRNLQYHVATYYNNEEVPLPVSQQKTGGRPIKSIAERISGKTGRIRQNLNGKRVEGSGRAVITSDPSIGIDEVGIPLKIAMSIPFPETVTPDNYEKLTLLVKNGRDIYPGVNKIVKKNGVSYDIRYRNRPIKLQYGDIVERHLVDGDYVLFNRQPSLHKLSMMGHRVKVSLNPKFTTFSMNPSTCKPYNADFDGDEMNVFVPQTIQSVVELSMLANVTSLIVSPRNTEPIIELRQDSVLGSYLFTETDQHLSWNREMDTLMVTKNIDFGKIAKKESSTFNLMSHMIPDINLSMGGVKVENGKYTSGKVTSKILNNSNGFIGIIYDQYDGDITRDFIDNVQKVVLSWLYKKGFTVGIKDCIMTDKILTEIKDKTNKLMLEVKHLITEQENHPGLLDESIFENNMATMLSAHAGNMGKIAMDNINHDNNFYIMVNSGAKGKVESIGHIACIVGQINMNNKRIAKKVNNRTLPHYAQYDDTPHARGFVTSSYMKGLRPAEFFFLTMAGRDGLIDTAIKSVTGDTPIVIYESGKSKYVTIGDWIDAQLEKNKDKVQHFEEREMEYLEVDTSNNLSIPTTDADGNVTWGAITAITRHLPGKELYEIKTAGGKKVIVTESKSLLIYNHDNKQFERMDTPNVKPGHFVPVTMNLPTPPIITTEIDMNEYLPKSEYIYGSEFMKASVAVADAMEGREHIPSGWWESNNGKTFTLPYDSKAKFQRATVRSNMNNIKEGYIYPFTTNREHSNIPDKFILNEINGKFIGLFLAEGNVDVKSGYVGITNNNANIQKFINDWFDSWGLHHTYESHINQIGGTSSTIRGYSTIVAKFLDKILGHGAENKYVPDFAYAAPNEFIIGLLNGYFSGDGTITENSIQVGSASSKLIDGISMLCTRLGIFGKVGHTQMKSNNLQTENILPTYTLSIRSLWATKFAELVPMIDGAKDSKLKIMKATSIHRNFTSQNDVVLDEIIEINKIDVNLYPKVYDLTIPSTLNFGLANGLHVVDTADTGYIQRKFIKGMEDVMVYYDGLVRSANNQIIQYFYGGSNLDQVKQKPVKITLINMNNDKIRESLVFTKDELKTLYKKNELLKIEPMNEKFYKKLVEFRDELRRIVMCATGNYITLRDEFMLPVNMHRIINSKINSSNSKSDLEYDDVMNTIEEIIKSESTKMFCMKESERKQENSYKKDLETTNKFMFIVSIYEYLSPKKCILKYKLTKKSLEEVKNEIIHNFNKAIVDPGEMVGVLGAQSMGEKSTQLNLNTKHSAGAVKKGTTGVARMNEILRCTKNIKTPMLTIYLDDKYKHSKESAYKIASYISYLTLQDIVLKGDIGYDPDIQNGYLKDDNIDVKTAMQIYDTKLDLKKLPWMFRFSINRDMLYAKKLKLAEIKVSFVKFWKSKLNTSKVNNKTEKDIYSRVVSCAILSSTENDPNPVIHIRFELNNYDVNKIIELQDYILSNFNLKGLDGISNIDVLSQSQVDILKDGSVESKEQYMLITEGINMSGIRSILGIDHTRTITNDMYSIYANFGIEAVRNKLINEITELIDNVNYHHISLLIDVMTHSGSLISIDRHGINRQDTDPLSRASFEKTMEQFINAAAFNETDKLKSVSSRIIIGRMINGGTGYCQLLMDNDILENTELNISSIQQGLSQSDDLIKLEDNMIIDDLITKDSEMYIV
jgi:DNA-directed RNA polymerase beta' subunit